MIKRIITAAVSLCIFAPFLIFSGTPLMLVFACVMSVVAVCELFYCVAHKRIIELEIEIKIKNNNKLFRSIIKFFKSVNTAALGLSVLIAAFMPIIARYSSGENFYRYIFIIFFTHIFALLAISVFMNKN